MTTIPIKPSFDESAQSRLATLFRSCPTEEFLQTLEAYEPRDRAAVVEFEKYLGWAMIDAGEYIAARPHLVRALRAARPGSADRILLRGLLGDCFVRVGELERAEQCVHRGLSSDLNVDDDHYLEAGHLFMYARIQYFRGQIASSLQLLARTLTVAGESNPMWVPAHSTLALCHLQLGAWDDLERVVARAHAAVPRDLACKRQIWAVAEAECSMALALGDADRAARVVEAAKRESYASGGARVQILLDSLESLVRCAQGQSARAEAVVRPWFELCEPAGRNADMGAIAARSLATALFAQARYADALAPARFAIRVGSVGDRYEYVTGLRIVGECHLALGDLGSARRAFLEALSLHAGTEYVIERQRLEETLKSAGFGSLARSASSRPDAIRPGSGPSPVHRIELPGGRRFLSSDTRLVESIRAAALTDLPVLIEGETGTGKELVARLLHELGPRALRPLVVVDCTSLPGEMADAELFGLSRGSRLERAGLIAAADGGTLLLDELPDLSLELQSKLLRVVQEGEYRRVGEDRPRRVSVRFVATTNRGVQALLESKRLKPDLFYRLSGHRILLRPLRTRPEEIPFLARDIVVRSGLSGLTPAAASRLRSQPWPGNVRQLEMLLRLAAAELSPGAWLDLELLEHLLARQTHSRATDAPLGGSLRENRIAGERTALVEALEQHNGVVTRAAKALGLSRQAFYKAMQRTGLVARQRNGARQAE